MAKYRKKPIVIEATQWLKNGDHPEDNAFSPKGTEWGSQTVVETEGKVVRYFRRPDVLGTVPCGWEACQRPMNDHGWIDTLEGGHIVCPGDFVITGIQGERYPCKPDIFEKTYEPA